MTNKTSAVFATLFRSLLAPTAYGQFEATVYVNPGTPGNPVNDLSWTLDEPQQWLWRRMAHGWRLVPCATGSTAAFWTVRRAGSFL